MAQKKPIKVLIAEDDPHNRQFLKSILERHPDFEVIGEAVNGKEFVILTARLKPHAVFVDIEMPEMDGMTAVKKLLEINEDLIVVFVTGHSDFAVEAFEVSSFDYILKPYRADRIETAMDKIRDRLNEQELDLQKLYNIFKSSEKLHVKCGYELHFVDTNSILYIEKEGKKTVIRTNCGGGRYETNETINELEKRLNPMDFFRSHKCYLINLKKVEKIIPWGDNSYLVKFFNCNNDALISRGKVKMLYDLLEIGQD